MYKIYKISDVLFHGPCYQGGLVFKGLKNLDGIRQIGIKWSSLD